MSRKELDELVKELRRVGICAPGYEPLLSRAADAIEDLQKTLACKIIDPPDDDAMAYGYPVRELIACAQLCKRHEIAPEDMHDFFKGMENGFVAGWNDQRITYKNMLAVMMKRVKVFSIPNIEPMDGGTE